MDDTSLFTYNVTVDGSPQFNDKISVDGISQFTNVEIAGSLSVNNGNVVLENDLTTRGTIIGKGAFPSNKSEKNLTVRTHDGWSCV